MQRLLRTTALIFWTIFAHGALSQTQAPNLMLATVYEGEDDVSGYWVSEKLDGVRGRWDGTTLWSRGGHVIAAPGWFTEDWPAVTMDGELWIGRESFEEVSGIVRSSRADNKDWKRIHFMVFDLPEHPGTFDQRLQAMNSLLEDAKVPWLQAVEQVRVESAEVLDARLAKIVDAGGEGLMLHHRESLYRSGRSERLLKYKPYQDAEARVVGYTEGKGKYAGMVGALEVVNQKGQRFRLGSGLSDAQRADPPPLGTLVTYRYNGLTSTGLPRFARFLRVRPEE